jgi:hypothetical protein
MAEAGTREMELILAPINYSTKWSMVIDIRNIYNFVGVIFL